MPRALDYPAARCRHLARKVTSRVAVGSVAAALALTGLTASLAAADDPLDAFTDLGLRGCVEAAASETPGGLADITGLDCSSEGVALLTGIDTLTGLLTLDLDDNQIATLAGVAFPASLQTLTLADNPITTLVGAVFPASLQTLSLDEALRSHLGEATFLGQTDVCSPAGSCVLYGPSVGVVPVLGVRVTPDSGTVAVGGTIQLSATVSPDEASDKTVAWTSSDRAVATVDAVGKITGVGKGTATITATTYSGGKTAGATITVTAPSDPSPSPSPSSPSPSPSPSDPSPGPTPTDPGWDGGGRGGDRNGTVKATGLTLKPTSVSLRVGDTRTLTATITPAAASGAAVAFASSNPAIATVDAAGIVKAIKPGKATITATCGDLTTATAVTVDKALTKVTIDIVRWKLKKRVDVSYDLNAAANMMSMSGARKKDAVHTRRGGSYWVGNVWRKGAGSSRSLDVKIGTAVLARAAEANMVVDLDSYQCKEAFTALGSSSCADKYASGNTLVLFKGSRVADVYGQFSIKVFGPGKRVKNSDGTTVQLAKFTKTTRGKKYRATVNPRLAFKNSGTPLEAGQEMYIYHKTDDVLVKLAVTAPSVQRSVKVYVKNTAQKLGGKLDAKHPIYKAAKKLLGTYSHSCDATVAEAYGKAGVSSSSLTVPLSRARTGDSIPEPGHISVYTGPGSMAIHGDVNTHTTFRQNAPIRAAYYAYQPYYNLFRYH
jgi:uncharacterized protein YjdB